jgi:hypothetical protein
MKSGFMRPPDHIPSVLSKCYAYANSEKWRLRALFLFIAASALLIYYPSFYHIARSDQTLYLANTSRTEGPALVTRFYSYDRITHLYNDPSYDELLFRPLFLIFLGMEKWFWGNNFMPWQVTGFLLHLIVIWNLLGLLWSIQQGLFAGLLVYFYANLFIGSEMVTWQHVNAYMIYLSLILFVLKQLYHITETRSLDRKTLLKLSACLIPICFLYEVGFLFSLICFFYVKRIATPASGGTRRSRAWPLLIPPCAYVLCNLGDLLLHRTRPENFPAVVHSLSFFNAVRDFFGAIYWWFIGGLFPAQMEVQALGRTIMKAPAPGKLLEQLSIAEPIMIYLAVCAILLTAGFCVMMADRLKSSPVQKRRPFAWLVLGAMLLHIGVIVIGRISARGLPYSLSYNIYYSNFFWIFLLALVYALIDLKHSSKKRPVAFLAMALACLSITIANGVLTLQLNTARKDKCQVARSILEDIGRSARAPRPSKGPFTFGIYPKDYYFLEGIRDRRDHARGTSYFEIMYPENYDGSNPACVYEAAGNTFLKRCGQRLQ